MRSLTFGAQDQGKQFILCYQALCFAKAPLARNELRAHGAVLTALEAIGEPSNPNRAEGDVPLFRCPAGGNVLLEEAEFALLERFVDAFVPDCHRALSREMQATLDWLHQAPTVPKPVSAPA